MNITRTLVLITCLATCLGLSAANSNSETQRMNPVLGPEMKIFNGINLDGWRGFFRDGSTDLAQAFSVEDGVLVCTGQPIGYIQTNRLYENFELIIEWRFDPEKGAGNSGVLMRIIGEDKVWPNCIEAQLHSTHAGDIWNIGEFPMTPVASRTNGRHTRKANPSSENPLGEWNRYRILLDRGHLVLEVNGVKQNVAQDCRQVPGRIGLQSEGAHIEFRKVSLRPIIAWEAATGS
ncbi:MAG: hypothetical protein CMJ39_06945 [Phycisphaerae bacterium]|nr:hypothetical protein [Phycisphaerae bacterium]